MNKDIQTLIEMESEEYAATVLPFMRDQSLYTHEMAYADCVKYGASFALSLFKWRKVSEELPEMAIDCKTDHAMDRKSDRVLIKTKHGFDVAVYNYYFEDFIANAMAVEGVTEWMPIPQID